MVQSAFMTDRRKGGWAGGEETEREDRAGGGGEEAGKTQNRVFKWVYRKASWHWNRHAPSHNGRDINFSALCFPLCHHSFSPSLSSSSPSALTLHLASSLSLTPFPPFYSFSLSSLIISLSSHFGRSHPRPLPLSPFLQMNSSFSFVRLPQSVSSPDSVCISAIGAFYVSVSSLSFRLIFLLMASKIMQGSVLFSL